MNVLLYQFLCVTLIKMNVVSAVPHDLMPPNKNKIEFYRQPVPDVYLHGETMHLLAYKSSEYPPASRNQLLCVSGKLNRTEAREAMSQLEMLAHSVCKKDGYQTFDSVSPLSPFFSNINPVLEVIPSDINCEQAENFEISCNRSDTPGRLSRSPLLGSGCRLFEVKCGSCDTHRHVFQNQTYYLNSPVYPRLQPGLVCEYDLESWFGVADMEINIKDVSLGEVSDNNHCGSSFLHILAGSSLENLYSVKTLCGQHNGCHGPINLKKIKYLKLRLVTGNPGYEENLRGYSLEVKVTRVMRKSSASVVGIIIAAVFGVFFLCCLVNCVSNKLSDRKKKRRRTRPGLRRYVAQQGVSYHQQRTAVLAANSGQVDNNGDNIYMIDTSVPRRLPPCPPPVFSVSSDQVNEAPESDEHATEAIEDDLNDVAFKLYETYESVSLNIPDREILERESRSESQNSNECQLSPTYLTLEERCVVPEEVKEVESDSSESFYSEIIA